MTYAEFSAMLETAWLSKKDFAAMTGRTHASVINWSGGGSAKMGAKLGGKLP